MKARVELKLAHSGRGVGGHGGAGLFLCVIHIHFEGQFHGFGVVFLI